MKEKNVDIVKVDDGYYQILFDDKFIDIMEYSFDSLIVVWQKSDTKPFVKRISEYKLINTEAYSITKLLNLIV